MFERLATIEQTYDELTQQMTDEAGLPAYEISNHARPGEESRHNLAYWRYQPYAGIGPGAHGRRGGLATSRHRKPENWLSAVTRNGHGIAEESPVTDPAVEALLMGLRLAEGVPVARVADAVDWHAAARLEAQGLLVRDSKGLRVQPKGMLLLDRILAEIAA